MLTLLKFCAAALVSTKAVHSVAPLLFPTYTDFDQWRYIYTIGERDLGRSAKCLANDASTKCSLYELAQGTCVLRRCVHSRHMKTLVRALRDHARFKTQRLGPKFAVAPRRSLHLFRTYVHHVTGRPQSTKVDDICLSKQKASRYLMQFNHDRAAYDYARIPHGGSRFGHTYYRVQA
ncbi:hypothetical protein BC629DRAFT_111895 [Irpex lacteus]|nr:hypothetical protein BC629DRAFT_111895 [Irpex lacteus]